MQAWLGKQLITVEGTPEEWAKFLDRLFYAYKNYPGEPLMRLFMDTAKQYPPKQENPTKRNWMPDLKWYDDHER